MLLRDIRDFAKLGNCIATFVISGSKKHGFQFVLIYMYIDICRRGRKINLIGELASTEDMFQAAVWIQTLNLKLAHHYIEPSFQTNKNSF